MGIFFKQITFRILCTFFIYGAFWEVAFAAPPSGKYTTTKEIKPIPDIADPSDLLSLLLATPEEEIDLLWSILVLDHYIDPNVDVHSLMCP